jgi:Zn-dependent protease with chaperone function
MEFFSAQDNARRKTWRLGALFAAAVLSLVLLTNLLVAMTYAWSTGVAQPGQFDLGAVLAALPAEYWFWITFGVLGMVAVASLYKYQQVRGGGRAVAESLGGRLVNQSTADLKERRLLNVVEEMAIASGIPVPPVYVIEEPSINAFAAGFTPQDAVIGVNRGTLDYLNRDELQGVIGHEFSHILNGDTRINLRLIAMLHGILFIGLVGRGLLYGVGRGARRRGSGGAPVLALGLGLLVIGYAGTFFGNLIKAAVSRQREFLADAASVQFTRNPGGIAGALRKIGGLGVGSAVSTAAAGEASHMFFGQVGRVFMNGLLSTHPPLDLRIRAIDPRWDGQYPVVTPVVVPGEEWAGATPGVAAESISGFAAGPATGAASAEAVANAVGRLDDAALAGAQKLIGLLPASLHDAAHDPFSARALMYALVIDEPTSYRQRQIEHLYRHAERGMLKEIERLQEPLAHLDEVCRLSLVDMAVPALKELSPQQYRSFLGNLIELIKVDRRIDLMEWVIHRILVKDLRPHFETAQAPAARHGDLLALSEQTAVLLSALAMEGAGGAAGAGGAFAAGMRQIGTTGTLDTAEDPNYGRLNRAIADLQEMKPLVKPQLIKACAATVLADDVVTPRQAALLRGVAAALDCPLPPGVIRGR